MSAVDKIAFYKTSPVNCKSFQPFGSLVRKEHPWYSQELCNDWPHAASALTLGESNVMKYGITFPLRTGLDHSNEGDESVEKIVYLEMDSANHPSNVEEYYLSRGVCLVSYGPVGGPSFIKGLYRPLTSYGTGVKCHSVIKVHFPIGDEMAGETSHTYICLLEKAGISLYAEDSSETHVSHVQEFRIDRVIPCSFGLIVVPLRGDGCDSDNGLYILTNPIKQVSKLWQKSPNRDYREYVNGDEILMWCEADVCVFLNLKDGKFILRRLVKLAKNEVPQQSTIGVTPAKQNLGMPGRMLNFATSSTSLFSPFPRRNMNVLGHNQLGPQKSAMRMTKEGSTVCYWPAFDFSNASAPGLGLGFFPPHVCVYDDPEISLNTLFEIEAGKTPSPWREPRKFQLLARQTKFALLFLIQNQLFVEGVDVSAGAKLCRYAIPAITDFECPSRRGRKNEEDEDNTLPPSFAILQTDGSVRLCWLDEDFKIVAMNLVEHKFPEVAVDSYFIRSLDGLLHGSSTILCTYEVLTTGEEDKIQEGRGIIELRNFIRDGLVGKCYRGLRERLKGEYTARIVAKYVGSFSPESEELNTDWKDFVQIILHLIGETSGEEQIRLGTHVFQVVADLIQLLKVSSNSGNYLKRLEAFGGLVWPYVERSHTLCLIPATSLFETFRKLLCDGFTSDPKLYNQLPKVLQILLNNPDSTKNLEELAVIQEKEEKLAPIFQLLVLDVFFRNCRKMSFNTPEIVLRTLGRNDYLSGAGGSSGNPEPQTVQENKPEPEKEVDETSEDPRWASHILYKRVFSEDRRLEEVCRLLDSSTPLIIDIDQRTEMSDHELVEETEKMLLQQVQIVLSASVGRTAFTLRTEKKAYSNLTTTIQLPKLCLTGKWATKGTSIELSDTDIPPSYSAWPNFHNAVAAAVSVKFNDSPADAWFAYNKATSQEGPEQAGMVLGFGLNGILNSMPPTLKHEHLARENSFTSMSILLGLSANLAGTGDMSTWKLVSLHIGAMLPACTTELEIPRLATLVAPCALGLLFIQTHNSHIAKVLLGEISKRFSPLSVFAGSATNNSSTSNINTNEMTGVTSDREAHSLCAGFGLGFVSLGKGRAKHGNLMEDGLDGILRRFVVGGPKPAHLNPEEEDFGQFGQTLPSMWEEYRCCHIEEGENVNVDVTTPAAIIAVALIYLRSGNEAVITWLAPPKTLQLLDGVRPDLLMLRAIALMLVYEDVGQFDMRWLELNIMPEALLKHALRQPEKNSKLDHESINQAWASIVCGYSLGLAIRFSGTGNRKVTKMLWHYTNLLLTVSLPEAKLSEYFPKNFLESCLCTLLISLSLVHSGTGDVGILRLSRYLQSKVAATPITPSNNTYGLEMCVSMSIGILFLGGGAYSLSNDDRSMAVILASVFPKWPINANDNRYHLQSLRHLYVLAAQPRLILPKPMPFNSKLIFHIETTDGEIRRAAAPVLLPPFHLIKRIWMNNSEFLPIEFTLPEHLPQLKKLVESEGFLNLVSKPIGSNEHGFLKQMEWRLTQKFHPTFEIDKKTTKEEVEIIEEFEEISGNAVWNGVEEIISPLLFLRSGDTGNEDWLTQINILKTWIVKSGEGKKKTCLTPEQIAPLLKKFETRKNLNPTPRLVQQLHPRPPCPS